MNSDEAHAQTRLLSWSTRRLQINMEITLGGESTDCFPTFVILRAVWRARSLSGPHLRAAFAREWAEQASRPEGPCVLHARARSRPPVPWRLCQRSKRGRPKPTSKTRTTAQDSR